MCGRFSQADPARLHREFSITGVPARLDVRPRYNVAPSDIVPVVRVLSATEGRRIDLLRWGLVPSWSRESSIAHQLINARMETLAERNTFRDPFRERRCLVVVDGFYEWQRREKGKQPYYVTRVDRALLAMAGLWDRWMSHDGEIVETFTVVTKPSVAPVAELHSRMPAILSEPSYDEWLAPGPRDPGTLSRLLAATSPELVAVPVSSWVNKPGHDGPACIEPIALARGLFDP